MYYLLHCIHSDVFIDVLQTKLVIPFTLFLVSEETVENIPLTQLGMEDRKGNGVHRRYA